MRKAIAALTAAILIAFTLCSCGNKDSIGTTSKLVNWSYDASAEDVGLSFDFDIDEKYTYMLVSVNRGTIYPKESEDDIEFSSETMLRLENGVGFILTPEKFSDEEDGDNDKITIISVLILNVDTTVHCGTISIVPKKSFVFGNSSPSSLEYNIVMESDDGLAIRQNENGDITIFAGE